LPLFAFSFSLFIDKHQDNDPLLLDNNAVHSNRGFALMNIHTRLQLYYGKNSGLIIDSSLNHGTTVTVNIESTNQRYLKNEGV